MRGGVGVEQWGTMGRARRWSPTMGSNGLRPAGALANNSHRRHFRWQQEAARSQPSPRQNIQLQDPHGFNQRVLDQPSVLGNVKFLINRYYGDVFQNQLFVHQMPRNQDLKKIAFL